MNKIEILKESYQLPLVGLRTIMQTLLEDTEKNEKSKPHVCEDSFLQILLAEGLISNIPETYTDEDDDFEPIEIEGEPLSESILKDRN